jgi:hypothetical protein
MNVLRRFCSTTLTTLAVALSLAPAHAQVVPSAFGPGHSLWVGAEYFNISASFPYQSGERLGGVGAFADYHLNSRIGFAGDARFWSTGGFEGSTESSYLAGPKAFFLASPKVQPYGKMLLGVAKIHYPYAIGNASYLALAPGAGVAYNLVSRWMLRFDYEYQIWHDSPGYANQPNHQLTPNGFHIGVAYRLSQERR